MKNTLLLIMLLPLYNCLYAQDTTLISKDTLIQKDTLPPLKDSVVIQNNIINNTTVPPFRSPYHTSFKTDGLVIAATVGVTLLGYQLIKQKHDLTLEELNNKNADNLPFLDRWMAGNYSDLANRNSYILFNASYVYPVVLMWLNKNGHKKIGQISALFVETIGITGALYTLSAGLVYRSRPFVYGENTPLDIRLGKGGQRSFYGGHVAATAAASFFMARVYKDFNGKTKLQPWLWTAAAVLPAVMAYERMRAGYHFLSDCIVSYGIGAATGLLIPALHKKSKKLQNITLTPQYGNDYTGLSLTYHIK
jgi:membrane-associated phospholipid phosphatase